MIRIRLLALPFAALLLATACMRSFGGPLDPVPAAGMEIGADHAALLNNGGLTARVTGQWSGKDSNSLLIVYHNGGPAPRTVAIHALKMTHPIGEAALRTALDTTGIDLTDARTDNDRAPILFSLDDAKRAPAILTVPSGASRTVDAGLTSFANDGFVRPGDRIVATIPLGDRAARLTFIARTP
ncbi:hypothetical protein ACSBM8_00360 [Sphingomonas sp. ASY06-1R]|uniref:hypothetical protein n=1 Tax=Sphingomonas sp. ASY06-1R TaxID=3445771 RepID=UPI003FA29631